MRPCDATDATQTKGCFPSKVIGGQPVVVHNREQHAGPAAATRLSRHREVEEFIVHGVQRASFDLGPLAADQWEEVWWTKLHDHERVT